MGLMLLTNDIHAEFDAFIADEYRRASDELAHLVLGFAAERAVQGILRIRRLAHAYSCPRLTESQGATLPPTTGRRQGPRPPSLSRESGGRGRGQPRLLLSSGLGRFSTTS